MQTALPLASLLSVLSLAAAPVLAQEATLQEAPSGALWTVPAGIEVDASGAAAVQKRFRGSQNRTTDSLWVETSFDSDGDGALDRVYVDVTRPTATNDGLKVAAIFETSPYYWGIAGADPRYFWDPNHELGATPPKRPNPPEIERPELRPTNAGSYIGTFVPRGFAVVHSASPGTGYSQGCPTIGGDNEALAPKAVIDWLCGRAKGFTAPVGGEPVTADWCNGKVAMIGTSFNGTLPLAAACTGVEGLATIVPVAPNTSYYHYYRSNGLVRHPGGYMGEDIDVLYDFVHSGDPKRRAWCNEHVRDTEMAQNQDRETGDFSDWWAGRDYVRKLDGVKVPVLMAHGFNDWNVMPEHSVRVLDGLRERGIPTVCYYHQGGHGGDPPRDLLVRWMTRWLYGVENGVEHGPGAYIVREGDRRSEPTAYPSYPHPDATAVVLHPSGDGSGVGTLGRDAGAGIQTVVDDVSIGYGDLMRAKESAHRLLFQTAELTEDVHLSGRSRVVLRVGASKPAVNLSVYLVALPFTKNGRIFENVITRGWADPQNAESLTESKPLAPGQFVDLAFDLQPDDQVVPAGARIGLMIFASDADFTLKPEPGTELSVDLGSTSIELPVVGGLDAWKAAAAQ